MDESADISLLVQLVKKQPVFSQLTNKEIEELVSLFTEIKVAAEEKIVKEGDPVDSIYLIASGTADVRHVSIKDGNPEVSSIAILSAGDAIGLNETGFYSISGKRTATVVALTEMYLFRLSVAAFHGFSLAHSHVSEVMHKHAEDMMNEKS
ncbi:MAG: cyclic nucleotide-binding domain-containing protein [Gammaproteobacteria bacterium]|nr:cyclic nucleotide-binding domain-containing protein [Gammaproteobacteria bacterium]MCW5583751.1 cyclic nucleotide-binding domain-containing protein [Gammaproteobacteria bacterium]